MKLNYLAMLSVVSVMNLSVGTFMNPPVVRAESVNISVNSDSLSGTFVSVDPQSQTQGVVRIVTDDRGNRYLELDRSFQTSEAPDLFVVLHRSEKPESYEPTDYINLGRLQQLTGTQRYAIPDNVNLSDYGSVVIWCKEFNVTMGYASFGDRAGTAQGNPCAAKPNPCAAKPNPCAAKPNPCAGR